jgi:hypothetical protein
MKALTKQLHNNVGYTSGFSQNGNHLCYHGSAGWNFKHHKKGNLNGERETN